MQKERWKNTPLYEWYEGKRTFVGIQLGEEKDKRMLTTMTLRKHMFGEYVGDWDRAWQSIHAEVNGQVKNYLVALRTLVQAPMGSYKIFIRGSKMSQASGMWHQYFLEFVASYYKGSEVTFNDPCEYAISLPQEGVTIKYDLTKTEQVDADIVIDDAHDGLSIIPLKTKAKYFSLKGLGDHFLIREGRQFSHEIKVTGKKICPCIVCEQIHIVSHDYESYMKLWADVQALGYVQCISYMQKANYISAEMRQVQRLAAEMSRGEPAVVKTPIQERAAQRLQSLINVEVVKGRLQEKEKVKRELLPRGWENVFSYRYEGVSCTHASCQCPIILTGPEKEVRIPAQEGITEVLIKHMQEQSWSERMEDECYMVRGKSVIFVGVTTGFFGSTKLGRGKPEVLVSDNPENILSHNQVPMVFVNSQKLLGYHNTGYQWKDKTLFTRKSSEDMVYDLYKLGRVYSKIVLKLENYNPTITPVETLPIVKQDGIWRIKRYGQGAFNLAIGRSGLYTYVKTTQVVSRQEGFDQVFFHSFMLGIDSEKKPKSKRKAEWTYILNYYRRGVIKGLLTDVLALPQELMMRVVGYLIT